jgi:hypothetical protein
VTPLRIETIETREYENLENKYPNSAACFVQFKMFEDFRNQILSRKNIVEPNLTDINDNVASCIYR